MKLIRGRVDATDSVGQKILAELQNDGRLTVTDLAAKVGLSLSPCHRRLRELERDGVITGYRAGINAAAGLSFEALVFVTMRQEDRDTLLGFEQAVAQVPNVLQAQRLFGDPEITSCASSLQTSTPTPTSRTTHSQRYPVYRDSPPPSS